MSGCVEGGDGVSKSLDEVDAGSELDALVAERVMQWIYSDEDGYWAGKDGEPFHPLPLFSEQLSWAHKVEEEVERHGVEMNQYVARLIDEVFADGVIREWVGSHIDFTNQLYPMIHATAEQRCRAALKVVTGVGDKEKIARMYADYHNDFILDKLDVVIELPPRGLWGTLRYAIEYRRNAIRDFLLVDIPDALRRCRWW